MEKIIQLLLAAVGVAALICIIMDEGRAEVAVPPFVADPAVLMNYYFDGREVAL